jgi:voltage-gated potassium channel
VSFSRGGASLVLMLALLAILVFHPLLGGVSFESRTLNVTLVLGLIVFFLTLETRGHLYWGFGLGILSIVFNIAGAYLPFAPAVDLASHGFLVLFLGYAATVLLHQILMEQGRGVTKETLYQSVCAYIILGFLWGVGYSLIEHWSPGSFRGDPILMVDELRWTDFIYHSFVTLTTLGYGDLVPVAPIARSFTILEAVVGVFYGAALVARLVSLYKTVPSQDTG